MGASNAQILDYVKEEVDERNFDMILHVGGEIRLERSDSSIPLTKAGAKRHYEEHTIPPLFKKSFSSSLRSSRSYRRP
jgi:hypothetical protein